MRRYETSALDGVTTRQTRRAFLRLAGWGVGLAAGGSLLAACQHAAPGSGAAAIFTFTSAWNEFLLALVFINKPDLETVPVKIASMIVGDQYVWGMIMASAVLSSLPVIVLYFLAQRFLVAGLAAGAVKG